ncbi:ABC transporter ATP-binding protein, partial [Streptomyces tendae]
TENVLARRLRAARAGRTTVLISSSPLLLDHAERVSFLPDGRVVATGTHRELLARRADYRLVIQREAGHAHPPGQAPAAGTAPLGNGE